MSPGKKKLIAILVAVGILIVGCVVFYVWPGEISRDEAREIAMAHIGDADAFANRPSLDFESFRRAWSVEIVSGHLTYEVYVRRWGGEIIRTEVDR
jgi:hypothetical protein